MKLVTLVFSAAVVAVLSAEISSGSSTKRDLVRREKRSFRWLPFIGSSEPSEDEESESDSETLVPAQTQVTRDGITYEGPLPDASYVNSVISRGQFINNQIHYPIWRVHKYNGLHLQPLPVSLISGPGGVRVPRPVGQPLFVDKNTVSNDSDNNSDDDDDNESNSNSGSSAGSAGSPGSDFNNYNNDNIESDSGTDVQQPPITSANIPAELLSLAKEFGVTDVSKIDVAEVMNLLGTTTPEDTISTIKEIAATPQGKDLIRQFLASNDNSAAASTRVETLVPAETVPFAQYLLPQAPREGDDGENEPSPGIFQRVGQFVNFLNPFAGGEEIPLPPNDAVVTDEDDEEYVQPVLEGDYSSVPIPSLPELPALPELPGEVPDAPQLPQVHIPTNGALPLPGGGPYVRVRLPLAGFNPVPQIPVNPRYLSQLRSQTQGLDLGFPVRQQFGQNTVARALSLPTGGAVPNFHPSMITSSDGVAINVGQLPLSQSNYLAFKNAPQIKTSYGAPPLPYANPIESPENYFQPSPGSPNSYIHQEFELRPAVQQVEYLSAPSEQIETSALNPSYDNFNSHRPDGDQNQELLEPRSSNAENVETAASEIEPIVVTPSAPQPDTELPDLLQQDEPKQAPFNPKYVRHSPYDNFASGRVHRVDPKAMDLLPFTVRQILADENKAR